MAKPTGRRQPPRTWRDLMDVLRSWGWDIVSKPGGHWKVYAGDRLITTLSMTPSDRRAVLNAWSEAKHRRRSIDKEARK